MDACDPIPAAQYLRMSTEHQRYSLENQAEAIRIHAEKYGYAIVKTYTDIARSGVLFRNRPGLGGLLQDVIRGNAPFRAVLVYDVSRWGRFQDSDEAAHYEFVCRNGGVDVQYCAETFGNDTSLPATVMKAVKRAMAAQFSRDLGNKVLAAEKHWAEMGYKQGGIAGYGLRRVIVSPDGTRKGSLGKGETKCLQSDRVILVPGPAEEVACVREIYRMLVEEERTPFYIANELNRRGHLHWARRWTHQNVRRILTHPKYAGDNVWNRTSRRLGRPAVALPKDQWVIKPGAFEPVIDPKVFEKAQLRLANRTCAKSNDQVLATLQALLQKHGRLSSDILHRAPGAPSPTACKRRFGTLRQAFELAGYQYSASGLTAMDRRRNTQALRRRLINEVQSMFPQNTRLIHPPPRSGKRTFLLVDERVRLAVVVCRSFQSRGGAWRFSDPRAVDTLALLGRLRRDSEGFQDIYVLPPLGRKRQIALNDEFLTKGRRLLDLSEFCSAVRVIAAALPW